MMAGLGAFSFALFFSIAPLRAQPNVVVTIKPLHSLAAAIMDGVGEPLLLIDNLVSPHGYTLRPSDITDIDKADLLVWVGASLETSLRQKFIELAQRKVVVSVLDIPDITLLPDRRGTRWSPHSHDDGDLHDDESEETGEHIGERPIERSRIDPHVWLDPVNAQAIVSALVAALSGVDSENAGIYARNGRNLNARLAALDQEIGDQLKPVQGRSYLVFHDAYQYFERRYQLTPAGSLTVHPENAPTARRIIEVQRLIRGSEAKCIFSEPQFRSKMVPTLIEDTGVGHGTLDPIGLDLSPHPDLYFILIRNLAASIAGCIGEDLRG